MIEARHVGFYVQFFNFFSRFMPGRYFAPILIEGNVATDDKPVLLIGNHFSWWDGFFALYINQKVFRKTFHVMMLEDQLKPRMFLNKAGAFSIQKGNRSVIESLVYTAKLLKVPDNLVLIFPQGEIQSAYTFPFRFEKGIERIFDLADTDFRTVFYACMIDYFSTKKPGLYFYLQEFVPKVHSATELEDAYNAHWQWALAKQQQKRF